MKRITTFALWICTMIVSAQGAFAQSQFEGRIVYSLSADAFGGQPMEMVCNLKGEKCMMKMDMGPMGAMEMYVRDGGKSIVTVMAGQAMEMEIGDPSTSEQEASDVTITATGKKETINGYAAEEHIASMKEGELTLWVTKDIEKDLMAAVLKAQKLQSNGSGSAGTAAAFQKLFEGGAMPVRVSMQTAQGGMTIDLVKIEKKSLSDDVFAVPAGLNIQKMGR